MSFIASPRAPINPLRPPRLAGLAGIVLGWGAAAGGYMNIQVYSHDEVPPRQLVQAGIGVAADIAVPRAQLP